MAIIVNSGINAPIPVVPGAQAASVLSGSEPVAAILNPGVGGKGRQGDPGIQGPAGVRGPMGTIGPKCTQGIYMVKNISNFAQVLLAANPLRIGFVIENQGDVLLYVGFNDQVQAGDVSGADRGACLTKFGSFSTGLVNYVGAIYGITAAGNTNVFVAEFLE